jgi:hypothetical protein
VGNRATTFQACAATIAKTHALRVSSAHSILAQPVQKHDGCHSVARARSQQK